MYGGQSLCGNYCQFPATKDVNSDAADDLIMSPIGFNLPRPPRLIFHRHSSMVVGYWRKGMRLPLPFYQLPQ